MDFNTQRRAVGAIDSFAKRHRLLRPVCAAVKVLVIAFCSLVRAIDMAFSDKNGNFLGIKHKSSDKRQRIARAEGKKVRREYHAVKRPFFLRCVSAMLAVCFGFMIMPEGLAIPVFAAELGVKVEGGVITGVDGTFTAYPGHVLSSDSDSFTAVDENAFSTANHLTLVDLTSNGAAGLVSIGDSAFANSSLTTVKLYFDTANVTNISGSAFNNMAPDSAIFVDYQGTKAAMSANLTSAEVGFGKNFGDKIGGNTLIINDKDKQFSSQIPNNLAEGSVEVFSSYEKVYVKVQHASSDNYTGYAIYTKSGGKYTKIGDYKLSEDSSRRDIIGTDTTYYFAVSKSNSSTEFAVRPYKNVTAGGESYNLYSTDFTHAEYPQTDSANIVENSAACLAASVTVDAVPTNLDVEVTWEAVFGKVNGSKTGIEADFYVLYYYDESGKLLRDAKIIETASGAQAKYTDNSFVFGVDNEGNPIDIDNIVNVKVCAYFDPLDNIDLNMVRTNDKLTAGYPLTDAESVFEDAADTKYNGEDASEFYGVVSGTDVCSPEVQPPSNLKWNVGLENDDEITVSWDIVPEVDGYFVTSNVSDDVTVIGNTNTSVTVPVEKKYDHVEFWVYSFIDFDFDGEADENELSNVINKSTPDKNTIINADISKMRVSGFTTDATEADIAVLEWGTFYHPNGAMADGYIIEVYNYDEKNPVTIDAEPIGEINIGSGDITSYTLNNGDSMGSTVFTSGTAYEFVIKPVFDSGDYSAYNNFGNKVFSSKAVVMVRSESKPPVADSVTLKPGDRQIGISWTAPTQDGVPVDIDGYIVEVFDHNGKLVYKKTVNAKTTDILIEKLDNGEAPYNGDEYTVKLYSYYDAMDSCSGHTQPPDTHKIISDPWLNEEGEIPGVVPLAKIILYASWQASDNIEERGILLQWTKVNQSDSYQLWRKGWHKDEEGNLVPDDDFKLIYEGDKMEYLDRSQFIYEGKTYTYYVIPFYHGTTNTDDIYKDLMKSDEVPFTVNVKPAAPANVKSIGADGEITLSWDRVEGANGYRVYVVGDEANPIFVEQSDKDRISWTDDLLPNGVKRQYYVTAVVTIDPTDGSTIHIVAESDKAPVGSEEQESGDIFYAPMDLVGVGGENKVTLTWTAVKGAEGYVVCTVTYDDDGNPVYKEIDRVAKPTTVITGLENGEVYTYAVYAYKTVNNKVWNSEMSNHVTVIVGVYVPVPLDLKAVPGNKQVNLTWSAVKEATGYELECYDYSTGEYEVIATTSKPAFLHQNLTNGVTYRYRVRAYKEVTTLNTKDNKIYSDYSTVVSATPDAIYSEEDDPYFLETPKDFTVTAGDGQALLSWSKVDGAEGYEVYIVNDYGIPVALDQLSKTSLTHSGLTNGSIYTYTVRAYKTLPDGSFVYSDYSIYKTVVIGNYLAAPIDVVATPGDGKVDLTWSAVPGAVGYVVYAYDASQASFTAVGVVSGNKFTHTGLINGLTYTYMIAAYNTSGGTNQYSQYSLAVSATPNGDSKGSGNGDGDGDGLSDSYQIFIVGTTPDGLSHSELITAYTDREALTSDVDLRFSVNDDSTQAIYEMLNGYADGIDSFDVFPFDLTLYISGTYTRVQPAEGHYITVTMPVPDSFAYYGEDMQLMHITVDGKMEILPLTFGESEGIPMVQFKCSSFSPFAFVHYYTPEDMESSAAGTAAAMTMGSSVYSMRCSRGSELYRKRRRNKIYKIVK